MEQKESGFYVKAILGGIAIVSFSAFLFRYHKKKEEEIQKLKEDHKELKKRHCKSVKMGFLSNT